MAESLFDIFGDLNSRQAVKNVSRQPLMNIENMGKSVSTGPFKPNEPLKKGAEPKKSFLSNAGKALQSTPMRKAFSPRAMNIGSMIYSEEKANPNFVIPEDIEFTKPAYKKDNYSDIDLIHLSEPKVEVSPPSTPPPNITKLNMEFNCSYQDEFFKDDFYGSTSFASDDDDLNLPDLY